LKKQIIILGVSLLLMSAASSAKVIYLNSEGTGSFSTIQSALNAASDGDEIVLARGTYTGSGNRNLNFRGKAVTLRSQNPDSNECMQNTIIDAQGKGVIVRFINDEGQGTIFEGFTLGVGDVSQSLRGSPGLFEFSANARPTTRRLRNKPSNTPPVSSPATTLVTTSEICPGDFPPENRIWDGLNPFHQPVQTTNYHGSGDVNLDGAVTQTDILYIVDMINGIRPENIRADIDGDGIVDSADQLLLQNWINGDPSPLPAWWNELTTRQQRNNWINKYLARDMTDQHVYTPNFFVCHHFAYQMYIHGAFERDDFAVKSTEYNGGQTIYNLPVYYAGVSTPTDHAIIAILVGDDPENFDDWRFIEPQNDTAVLPGQSNLLYGSTLSVGNPFNRQFDMVSWYIDETGQALTQTNPDFQLMRSTPPIITSADNRKDAWHPIPVALGSTGILFFEKMREDMTRTTDIHVTDLLEADFETAIATTNRFHFSRLLDVTIAPDGIVHVLFESKSESDLQNLFHGTYDTNAQNVISVSQVAGGLRLPAMGRIEVTAANEIYVFWFENYGYSGTYERGIHWTKSTSSGVWQTPALLTGKTGSKQTANWFTRQFAWYVFDTQILSDGRVLLVYVEQDFPNVYLTRMLWDGTWSEARIEETDWTSAVQGVDLCTSTDGAVHLGYWRAEEPDLCHSEGEEPRDGRGNVYHRMATDLNTWSSPVCLDNSGKSSLVRLEAGLNNEVYGVWERRDDDRVILAWNVYRNAGWRSTQQISPTTTYDVWYPEVTVLPDGQPVAVWSERNDDQVTIRTGFLKTSDLNRDGKVDLGDLIKFSQAWLTEPGDSAWDMDCNISTPADNRINLFDFEIFCSRWLSGNCFFEDFETGDFSLHPWQHSGDVPWVIVSDVKQEGLYGAKSGLILDNQQSTLQIELDVQGNQIAFYKRVSSEQNYDWLYFYVDGIEMDKWSGEVNWSEETFSITPGMHTFTWTFQKDYMISSGQDCAWIDNIRVTN